eukprot:scaffold139743_cov55-Attheya_sp.AAC.3
MSLYCTALHCTVKYSIHGSRRNLTYIDNDDSLDNISLLLFDFSAKFRNSLERGIVVFPTMEAVDPRTAPLANHTNPMDPKRGDVYHVDSEWECAPLTRGRMVVLVPRKTRVKSFGITSSGIIIASFSLADDKMESYRLHMSKNHYEKYIIAVGKACIWSEGAGSHHELTDQPLTT